MVGIRDGRLKASRRPKRKFYTTSPSGTVSTEMHTNLPGGLDDGCGALDSSKEQSSTAIISSYVLLNCGDPPKSMDISDDNGDGIEVARFGPRRFCLVACTLCRIREPLVPFSHRINRKVGELLSFNEFSGKSNSEF